MGRAHRLGVFGGTFDPPHIGHLVIAHWALESLGLERVLFVPAGQPPHKRGRTITDARHRLAMTRVAVRGHPCFGVSTIELSRGGPSFTVDTLARIGARHDGDLHLVIGADSLDEFRAWHQPDAILKLARLAVAGRPGAGRTATLAWARRTGRVAWVGNPEIGISSSLVRERVREGHSCRFLVPDPVWRYIERHRLYRR
jgi:nicotinate-nucleotide adenylyltransferase